MSTTQQHLLIQDIKDDMLLLKNGGGALVLQVSAVNFGLLSDREQIAIISSFAQMLNSLSFSIQIVIYSERLNISSYLNLLDKAQSSQSNPLLSKMIGTYRQFIQNTIKENDVLDKKFFVIVPLFSLELGLTASKTSLEQKIKTVLLPRRDQIVRQLNRVGLKATQLTNQNLIELFYDIYNGQFVENMTVPALGPQVIEVNLKDPKTVKPQVTFNQPKPPASMPIPTQQAQPMMGQAAKNHPFVVEELDDKV
ncbi:hypothetical protein HY008_00825 [Candidatus Woesebacteria bacterium]|nr:hypothetical protein [Candidatus Woesebacteria bacterium]